MADPRLSRVSAVIAKVTSRCNISCAYCYENIGQSPDMPIETFSNIIGAVLQSSTSDKIAIILHGGEPMLLSNKWLRDACKIVEIEARVAGKSVRVGMQSNVLNLKDEKIRVLAECGMSLCASMDGPHGISTAMRPLAAKAEVTFLRARKAGLNVSVLMTINNSNWNKFDEIMEWLRSTLRVSVFKANPITPVGNGSRLTPLASNEIVSAKLSMLERMLQTGGAVVEDNLMVEIFRYLRPDGDRGRVSLCRDKRCGAGSSVVAFTQDGKMLPCGRLEWNNSSFVLGSLEAHDIDAADYFQKVESFHAASPSSWKNCAGCDAKKICSFGCQAFILRNRENLNVECQPTRELYSWFTANHNALVRFVDRYSGPWAYAA